MTEVLQNKRNKIGTLLFIAIAFIAVAIDQLSKQVFLPIDEGEVVSTIIPGLLQFVVVHNTGAAWGMFGDWTNVFVMIALVVCILIACVIFFKAQSIDTVTCVSLGFLFAGGLSNAIDRVAYGYVVDFISVNLFNFPVFNIADICITFGVILLLVSIFIVNRRAY